MDQRQLVHSVTNLEFYNNHLNFACELNTFAIKLILDGTLIFLHNNAYSDGYICLDDKISCHSQKERCNLILMIFISIIICINNEIKYITVTCHSGINNTLTSTHRPLIHPLMSSRCHIKYHSFSTQPPLNKTSTMIFFVMLFFIVDWNVVYWVSDEYAHRTDYLPNKIAIILSKLTRISLAATISMLKQLSYLCFGRCNVIEHWILWNYCLAKYFNCLSPYWLIIDTIAYIYSIWTKVDAIHRNCTYILYVNNLGGCKLQYSNAWNKNVTILLALMRVNCNEVILNTYEINNFELSILTIISVSNITLYQIKILNAIYTIISGANLFTLIDHIIPQPLIYVFTIIFKFNTSSCGTDSPLFYLIAMKADDFDLIIPVINSTNTITIQIDRNYVIWIVTMNELLMISIIMNTFKQFCMFFYKNFLINIVENWFFYSVSNEKVIFHISLLIMIIIISQFYIILCVLVYLDIRFNNIFIFQSRSPSNQRESNKDLTIQNTAQQKHILKIVVWIRMGTIYQHNGTISLEFVTFVSFGKSKIHSIHIVCTYQLDTNSGNAFRWNQNVIIW